MKSARDLGKTLKKPYTFTQNGDGSGTFDLKFFRIGIVKKLYAFLTESH